MATTLELNTQSYPWLPIEIVERILRTAWLSHMSAKTRTTFMTSSVLVNKTWSAVYAKVYTQNIHITGSASAHQFLKELFNTNPNRADDSPSNMNIHCRSLSFTLDNRTVTKPTDALYIPKFGDNEKLGMALSKTLYFLHDSNYLRNLRRINIEYANWGMDDVFDHWRFVPFPGHVTELGLVYSCQGKTTAEMIESARRRYRRHKCEPWSLEYIRHLSVTGTSEGFLEDILKKTPILETLEIDGEISLLHIGKFPDTLKKLTLRQTSPYPKGHIVKLVCDVSMIATHSGRQNGFNVVLEWSASDAKEWAFMKEGAQRMGVQFVISE